MPDYKPSHVAVAVSDFLDDWLDGRLEDNRDALINDLENDTQTYTHFSDFLEMILNEMFALGDIPEFLKSAIRDECLMTYKGEHENFRWLYNYTCDALKDIKEDNGRYTEWTPADKGELPL